MTTPAAPPAYAVRRHAVWATVGLYFPLFSALIIAVTVSGT